MKILIGDKRSRLRFYPTNLSSYHTLLDTGEV